MWNCFGNHYIQKCSTLETYFVCIVTRNRWHSRTWTDPWWWRPHPRSIAWILWLLQNQRELESFTCCHCWWPIIIYLTTAVCDGGYIVYSQVNVLTEEPAAFKALCIGLWNGGVMSKGILFSSDGAKHFDVCFFFANFTTLTTSSSWYYMRA